MKKILTAVAIAMMANVALAGEYHAANTLLCYDCHTMHFSMQHGWAGGAVASSPALGGDWLSTSGPNMYLLKAPESQVCIACHDGQAIAPDVMADNFNAGAVGTGWGRSAGALNETGTAPYQNWKGHTIGATTTPPGFNPVAVGFFATWYSNDLECTTCHTQHGRTDVYRNLGPRSLANGSQFKVTYVLSTTNNATKDVWINLASYTAGSGVPATQAPFYDAKNVFYNRNDSSAYGTTKSSNTLDVACGACHGNYHGGYGDVGVGGVAGAGEFIRHPTAQVEIGALGGGHSNLTRYRTATNRVKAYVADYTTFAGTVPGCISCHKAHGNQNPFGLVFMNRSTTSPVTEQGTSTAATPVGVGQRDLCGQCHGQGN